MGKERCGGGKHKDSLLGRPKDNFLIVIDGLDGCGKQTQVDAVAERFFNEGWNIQQFSFPQYSTPTGSLVKKFLDGEYGDPTEQNLYACSIMYSLDRWVANKKALQFALRKPKTLVILDRYVSSNMIYQGAKAGRVAEGGEADRAERMQAERMRAYFKWLEDFEYNLLEIPRADLTVILDVDLEVSQRLLKERYDRENGKESGDGRDGHERNLEYLRECKMAEEEALKYFKDWVRVDCMEEVDNGRVLKSKDEITKEIMEEISKKINI